MDDFVHEVRPNVRRIGDKDRKKGPVRCVQNVIMAYTTILDRGAYRAKFLSVTFFALSVKHS